MTVDEVEHLLYLRSGMLGVSGLSGDVRELRSHAISNPHAAEALDLFAYRTIREISALVGLLGGIDALVFTAGIGENDSALRATVIRALSWLGFELDEAANDRGEPLLTHGAGPRAWVIPTNEALVIARHVHAVLS
jgi:acetate kinase